MEYREITYAVDAGVLTLTLDRPDRLNAFTARMGDELRDALDRSDADDDVRAVVVTGAGRGFCAGADSPRAVTPSPTHRTAPTPTATPAAGSRCGSSRAPSR